MRFLGNLLAAILGCIIGFCILFFMFVIFVALISNADEGIVVKKDSVLEMQLQTPVKDYVGGSDDGPLSALYAPSVGLDEILHAIEVAKGDSNIKGISLNNNFLLTGMAQTKAIRDALLDFKESGKFVYAYADFYTQKDYYLASVADSVFVNNVGNMDFKGLSAEVLYYKSLQEKTGLKMEVVRHGKYKSAVEPFLEDTMSDANRSQLQELLTSVWGVMAEEIAQSRNLSLEDVNRIADDLGARNPELAQANHLVDAHLFYDEYEDKLKKATGKAMDGEVNYVELDDYIQASKGKTLYKGKDKIAVIYAQGEILYGEGGPNYIAQGMINNAIREAVDNEEVKAIVLRVDSPGGNALTSDLIWREIQLAKRQKPVVVSMGNVAASGGYYISVGADKIYAQPNTITGSIGVFGTLPNASGLAQKIGINAEQVGTHKNAVDYSLFEPLSPEFRHVVLEGVENTYATFLTRVAMGRGMTTEAVDSIAQGRVWSGTDAKRIGLVDELGGLEDAIAGAAELAGVDTYGIKKYPKYKTGLERLMENLSQAKTQMGDAALKEELGPEAYSVVSEIKGALQQKGIQVRMPYILNIK